MRPLVFLCLVLTGCAYLIVEGEATRTAPASYPARSPEALSLHFEGSPFVRQSEVIGNVTSRSYALRNGLDKLRELAGGLGADAVVRIRYERKYDKAYDQDLYWIQGDAVVWTVLTDEERARRYGPIEEERVPRWGAGEGVRQAP